MSGKKKTESPKLARTTFVTSREMDFFNEKELVTQTGHSRSEWPLVFCKGPRLALGHSRGVL